MSNARIMFVVHRYAPFPGGSEYYVRDMAEECVRRGYDVTVLAHEHQGDLNGVKVTNDYNILNQRWNLIVVHGGDVISQNIVHANAYALRKTPVVYMIIKPSESEICYNGLKHHRFIAYSTSVDINHIKKFGYLNKARRIRHGMNVGQTVKPKVKYPKTTFVSAGGFWPNKAMVPLAQEFIHANIPNTELHLYGYHPGEMPPNTSNVKVFLGKPKDEVAQAIASADAYIMNSYDEGFGLVLLEAMMNKTPWYARNIAGAKDMSSYGKIYDNESELMLMLMKFKRVDKEIEDSYNYVMANHTIEQTVNDIEDILWEI
jgi:glycosyltransferase involved in cell wall biosynthesis